MVNLMLTDQNRLAPAPQRSKEQLPCSNPRLRKGVKMGYYSIRSRKHVSLKAATYGAVAQVQEREAGKAQHNRLVDAFSVAYWDLPHELRIAPIKSYLRW